MAILFDVSQLNGLLKRFNSFLDPPIRITDPFKSCSTQHRDIVASSCYSLTNTQSDTGMQLPHEFAKSLRRRARRSKHAIYNAAAFCMWNNNLAASETTTASHTKTLQLFMWQIAECVAEASVTDDFWGQSTDWPELQKKPKFDSRGADEKENVNLPALLHLAQQNLEYVTKDDQQHKTDDGDDESTEVFSQSVMKHATNMFLRAREVKLGFDIDHRAEDEPYIFAWCVWLAVVWRHDDAPPSRAFSCPVVLALHSFKNQERSWRECEKFVHDWLLYTLQLLDYNANPG